MCSRTCLEDPSAPAPPAQEECRSATEGDSCHEEVLWSINNGIRNHPEWYPGLNRKSSFEEFQRLLHKRGQGNCPMPCMPTVTTSPPPMAVQLGRLLLQGGHVGHGHR